MAGNMLGPMNAETQDIPVVEVAALFQKDPQVFMTHPDAGVETFADMAKLPTIFLGNEGFASFFQWMKWRYPGFNDAQYKPYTFNPAPFIADKESAQQGYVTSEPYAVEQAADFKPKLFLLADNGFSTPSTMIEAKRAFVEKNPDLVQRFVDASIIGWYNYLYGDNTAANEAIKRDNPDMTDGQLAFTLAKMKEYGLVDSGIAAYQGHRLLRRRSGPWLLRHDGAVGGAEGRGRHRRHLHESLRVQRRRAQPQEVAGPRRRSRP